MSTLRTTTLKHGGSTILDNLVLSNAGETRFCPNSSFGRAALYVDGQTNRVGVNTETPGVALDVDGAISATGNVAIGGTLSVTGNVDFNGTIDADNEFLTVGGMQIRRNLTPTSGAGIELFRSGSGYGQIQAYSRDSSALIGLYINSENWKILQTGDGQFGEASNSTNNNGVLIGGSNGSLNVYTTRYSTDCFQIINTSGSGNNVAHQLFGNGKANLAGGDLRIEQITGDTSNSVRITTDPSSSGSGSTLVFNMDSSQDAVTIYNSGLRVGSGGVDDRIQLDGSAGNATFAGRGAFGLTSAVAQLDVKGEGTFSGATPFNYLYATGGSERIIGNESSIDIISTALGNHASSILLRGGNTGFGLVNDNDNGNLDIKYFVASGNSFYVHGNTGGSNCSTHVSIGSFTSNGNLLLSRTNDQQLANIAGIRIAPGETSYFYTDSNAAMSLARQTDNGQVLQFRRGTGTPIVGSVSVTASPAATQFNTSASDKRLKKNFESWNENVLDIFKDLEPQKYNFTAQEDSDQKDKGFIAQDLVEFFPEAYPLLPYGDDDAEERYMFNPGGMVVYLMKALQEAAEKIESLESRIASLENT